jgi:hemerythrin-like metal-binding protein
MIDDWTAETAFGIEAMDLTHREFVGQLNAMLRLSDDKVPEGFARLIDHTVAHFGRENAWMQEHRYPHGLAHVAEHDRVLKVMTAIARFMETGEPRMGRMVARELASWFRQHARTMDADLARFLSTVDAGTAAASPKRTARPQQRRAGRASRPVSSAAKKRRNS